MEKRLIDGIEVQRSSGNVDADPGLPDAQKLKITIGVVVEIWKAMRRLDWPNERPQSVWGSRCGASRALDAVRRLYFDGSMKMWHIPW